MMSRNELRLPQIGNAFLTSTNERISSPLLPKTPNRRIRYLLRQLDSEASTNHLDDSISVLNTMRNVEENELLAIRQANDKYAQHLPSNKTYCNIIIRPQKWLIH